MRRVRIDTCTSGEPVSASCIRESAIISVFSSSVNATLVFYLLLCSKWEQKITLFDYNIIPVGTQFIAPIGRAGGEAPCQASENSCPEGSLSSSGLLNSNLCANFSHFLSDLLSLFLRDT